MVAFTVLYRVIVESRYRPIIGRLSLSLSVIGVFDLPPADPTPRVDMTKYMKKMVVDFEKKYVLLSLIHI